MKKIRKINTNKRKKERKEKQKALQRNINLMLDFPEECYVCEKLFDKKDRKMAQTWNVTIFESKEIIRLTCPGCWGKVKDIIEREVEDKNV